MNPNHPIQKLPDFDPDLESDAIWNTLAEATDLEPSPAFLQNTLRRVRLEADSRPWWKSLTPRRVWTASFAALGTAPAVVALMISSPSDPTPVERATSVETAPSQWTELEDALASEVLTEAAENPAMFSDQEIVALLY